MPLANYSFASLRFDLGRTSPANVYFPDTDFFRGIELAVGKTNYSSVPWAKKLHFPRTGWRLSYSDFGNTDKIGRAVSAMPFIDFSIGGRWTNRLRAGAGLGASYFDLIYSADSNPTSQAISTHWTWSFRSDLRYDVWRFRGGQSQLSLGYYHNSNGHVRLPNYGLNTFLLGFSTEFYFNQKQAVPVLQSVDSLEKKKERYYCYRFGLGQNVLTKFDKTRREVYSVSATAGRVVDHTFKYGLGFYYRFYESYYHYITNQGELVEEMYPELKKHPMRNASSFGVFAEGELLLGHVGVEMQVGLNFYKPFYKVDWKLNQGKIIYDGSYELGKLNWYYNVKHLVSSRLGMKWYALNTSKAPRHNVFVGAFINANLGQADFTELGVGYVYTPAASGHKKR